MRRASDTPDKWAPDLGAPDAWALDSSAGGLSLGAAIEHFLTAKAAEGASPKTLEWYRMVLGRAGRDLGADRALDALTPTDLRAWLLRLRETLSPISVAGYVRGLKAFGNWCASEQLAQARSLRTLSRPQVPHKRSARAGGSPDGREEGRPTGPMRFQDLAPSMGSSLCILGTRIGTPHMPLPIMFALNVVAIALLVFSLYFPRHRRKDMVAAYLVSNLGLLAVTSALTATEIGVGIGFGLFAVLSIIRLRSAELDQQEIAYYFAALTLGLLGGLSISPAWLAPTLMGAVLLAVFLGDSPLLFSRYRIQTLTLDAVYTDERTLIARLEELLGARVHRIKVRRADLVEATTVVEARYELLPAAADRPAHTVTPIADGVR
ncbi:MAG TPA: DUF4956 domain-containing protein [Candidatus Binatia bacterium]|nr:DUF4956 domain-containing protein [Candidatus Binatia bacterium]